jgi:hypothetical protein
VRPAHAENVQEAWCDDGGVLLFRAGSEIGLRLSSSAVEIWDACDGQRTVDEVCRELEGRYGLPQRSLEDDVLLAIDGLRDEDLLRLDADVSWVDFSMLARPRDDLEDLHAAIELFQQRNGRRYERRPMTTGRPAATLCHGAVAIEHALPESTEDLPPAPLDHPNIARAEEWLARWPLGYRQFAFLMRSFHPLLLPGASDDELGFLEGSTKCHSLQAPAMFGAMWSTVDCPFMLAENFVHEMAHQKLYGIGVFKEHCTGLIANDLTEGFRSPVILDRPRPMTAIVHAVYSYMYVTAFDLAILEREPPGARRDSIVLRLDVNLGRLEDGRAEMHGSLRLDAKGEQFFAGFYPWLDELIADGRAVVTAAGLVR